MLNDKNRKPWTAGLLNLLTIGLGHIYAGHAKKGILLFVLGQGAMLSVFLPLIYYFPTVTSFGIAIFCGLAFLVYCICDAVKLSKRQRHGYLLKGYNKWYVYLGCWILASFILQPIVSTAIKAYFVEAYKIPAASLKPTLLVGDFILARKSFAARQEIKRGDLIIFPLPHDPSKDFIKRVVAMGGETIEILDKKLFVNGNFVQEPYVIFTDPKIIPKDYGPRDNLGPLTIPEDALFVMGDNRDQSNDSRFFGIIKKATVKGKACAIYWSWDKENFKIRWDRIGKTIE